MTTCSAKTLPAFPAQSRDRVHHHTGVLRPNEIAGHIMNTFNQHAATASYPTTARVFAQFIVYCPPEGFERALRSARQIAENHHYDVYLARYERKEGTELYTVETVTRRIP
ncbi:MAG: hypothetical protein Q4B06_02620 [Candidatus Saccharibacteria bacterium]|nr:hypothetical protein [Candidatus Saccharibacteria bacterium]